MQNKHLSTEWWNGGIQTSLVASTPWAMHANKFTNGTRVKNAFTKKHYKTLVEAQKLKDKAKHK